MTTLNNVNIDQLVMMLEFMRHIGLVDQEYALGVVTAGHPANVNVYGTYDLNVPIAWVYNDNAESRGYLGHWEGFERSGDGVRTVMAWGFNLLEAADIPTRQGPRKKDVDEATLEKRRTTAARAERARKKNHCAPCQARGLDCDGVIKGKRSVSGKMCTPCAEDGLECEYPDHVVPVGRPHTGNEILADPTLLDAWQDKSLKQTSDCGTELPTPDTPFFQVFLHIRCSSNPGPEILAQLNALFPMMAQRYNNWLNASGTRPGGPGTFMLWQPVLLSRRGNKQAPSQLGNLIDPSLIAFVNRMHVLANPPPPGQLSALRIQHVTMGLAGFTVGIAGYGNRLQGLTRYLLDQEAQHNIPLASVQDIVSVVEARVVDGGPDSLHHGMWSPNWQHYHGKYLQTNGVLEMVDRYARNQLDRLLHDAGLAPFPTIGPNDAHYARLDHHIWALQWEHEWRANHLGANTVPTDQDLASRNTNRNRAWV
ncbi:hypothetical protein LTR27_002084 [Elasticomyces elasticus]|nr:hypothetical protein LTR27_002084 [Elasticomyces elasticus]